MIAQKPYHNFKKALSKLEEFLSTPAVTERDKAGVIKAFEYTYEQCWKAFQKILKEEGVEANSPKRVLSESLTAGFINTDDEEDWLKMIGDRNETTHIYNEDVVIRVESNIESRYLGLFRKVLKVMEDHE